MVGLFQFQFSVLLVCGCSCKLQYRVELSITGGGLHIMAEFLSMVLGSLCSCPFTNNPSLFCWPCVPCGASQLVKLSIPSLPLPQPYMLTCWPPCRILFTVYFSDY